MHKMTLTLTRWCCVFSLLSAFFIPSLLPLFFSAFFIYANDYFDSIEHRYVGCSIFTIFSINKRSRVPTTLSHIEQAISCSINAFQVVHQYTAKRKCHSNGLNDQNWNAERQNEWNEMTTRWEKCEAKWDEKKKCTLCSYTFTYF